MQNYDVSIFIVTENGEMIFVNEYDKSESLNPEFVMLTNDRLNSEYGEDNTIFIYKYWKDCIGRKELLNEDVYKMCNQSASLQDPVNETRIDDSYTSHRNGIKTEHFTYNLIWQADYQIIQNHDEDTTPYSGTLELPEYTYNDFNGYRNTVDIISKGNHFKEIHNDDSDHQRYYSEVGTLDCMFPAIMAAHHNTVGYKGKPIHGYLPSAGQMLTIDNNVIDINSALLLMDGDIMPTILKIKGLIPMIKDSEVDKLVSSYWTSTEGYVKHIKTDDKTYCDTACMLYRGNLIPGDKVYDQAYIFPLFKIEL